MLNSIREIFDFLGLHFESMQFVPEKFPTQRAIIDAINNQRKCPAIVGAMFDFSTGSIDAHVMVAAGVKTESVQHGSSIKQEYFIQCKNSYRDDPNLSGKFHRSYRGSVMYWESPILEDQICLQSQLRLIFGPK